MLFIDIPDTSKCCSVHQVISRLREQRNVMLFIDIPDTSKCCSVHQVISRKVICWMQDCHNYDEWSRDCHVMDRVETGM